MSWFPFFIHVDPFGSVSLESTNTMNTPSFPSIWHLRFSREVCNKRLLKPCYSVTQLCPTLCDPMDCSTPGLPDPHHLPQSAQTHDHWVCDAIQPSHPLSLPSLLALNLLQHQVLFQWVGSVHMVAKALELQHQSFQWMFRIDFL